MKIIALTIMTLVFLAPTWAQERVIEVHQLNNDEQIKAAIKDVTIDQEILKDFGAPKYHCLQGEGNSESEDKTNHSSGLYGSVIFGNGVGGDAAIHNMQWKTFEIRLGKDLDKTWRVDFFHYNEGHPQNNHRDGFGVQGVYKLGLSENTRVELGVGPYLSFNTTTVPYDKSATGEVELDDKRIGILTSMALLYYPEMFNNKAHLRLSYNHTEMPGAPSSDALLAGIGFDLSADQNADKSLSTDEPIEVALLVGNYITNHGGTKASKGLDLELKKNYNQNISYSLNFIKEGSDKLVRRKGVALRGWYGSSVGDHWSFAVGAGPYLSKDDNKSGVDANGIISLEAKRKMTKRTSVVLRFNRIMDINHGAATHYENDRDLMEVGISHRFN